MALARFIEGTAFGVLNDILSTFHSEDGYATPNRFEVLITRPQASANENREVSMRCESINLPGRNLNTLTDTNIYGPTREVVDGVTYADDITMTFQASSGLEERVFFEEWQSLAFDERTWNVGYYNDYISTIDVYLLDRQDNRRYGLKFWEVLGTLKSGIICLNMIEIYRSGYDKSIDRASIGRRSSETEIDLIRKLIVS